MTFVYTLILLFFFFLQLFKVIEVQTFICETLRLIWNCFVSGEIQLFSVKKKRFWLVIGIKLILIRKSDLFVLNEISFWSFHFYSFHMNEFQFSLNSPIHHCIRIEYKLYKWTILVVFVDRSGRSCLLMLKYTFVVLIFVCIEATRKTRIIIIIISNDKINQKRVRPLQRENIDSNKSFRLENDDTKIQWFDDYFFSFSESILSRNKHWNDRILFPILSHSSDKRTHKNDLVAVN